MSLTDIVSTSSSFQVTASSIEFSLHARRTPRSFLGYFFVFFFLRSARRRVLAFWLSCNDFGLAVARAVQDNGMEGCGPACF